MNCKYCEKLCKNKNSLNSHQIRCFKNPNKIKNSFEEYNKTLASQEIRNKNNAKRINKTNVDIFGEEKAKIISDKISFKNKGLSHDEETKLRISKSMMGNRNAKHRGDRQSYYKDIRMDSSWEVKVAKYLDDNNYNWKYDSEKYLLSDGRYIHPDFFIYDDNDNLIKIIEVKGYFRDANKLKFEMFLNEYAYLNVELWNKSKLKLLNIL